MSEQSFLQFLLAVRDSPAMKARYLDRNLIQIRFHAKNEGFDFTLRDVSTVVGAMEANVILAKDADAFDGTSRLWREMWGRPYLTYLLDHVVARHVDDELSALVTHAGSGES
jgi:hypothetical protein